MGTGGFLGEAMARLREKLAAKGVIAKGGLGLGADNRGLRLRLGGAVGRNEAREST